MSFLLLRSVIKNLVVLAALVFPIHVIIFLLPFLLLNFLVRSSVGGLAKVFRPDLSAFVAGEEALFALENSNKSAMNIIIVALVKGPSTVETLRKHMEERVLQCKDPLSGELLYKRLKQTWEGFLGYAFWKTDLKFDIRNHVRGYDYAGDMKLGSPCKLEELHAVLGRLYEAPWDRTRSPWEMLHVPNVLSEQGEDCTAMILRVEHILGDGYSLLGLYKKLTQSRISVPKQMSGDRAISVWEKLALVVKFPWDMTETAVDIFSSRKLNWTSFLNEKPVIVSVSPSIPVELIKRIKNHFGVSYAAVVYSSVLGAIERAVKETGRSPPALLSGGVVVPRMGHPQKGMVVYATLAIGTFPCKAGHTLERLHRMNEELRSLRKSSISMVLPYVAELASTLPMSIRRIVTRLILRFGASLGITSFPVSTSPEYWDGHEVVSSFGGCGTFAPVGIIVTTFGVNNQQVVQIAVNRSVFTDISQARNLAQYVAEEVQDLATKMELSEMWQSIS